MLPARLIPEQEIRIITEVFITKNNLDLISDNFKLSSYVPEKCIYIKNRNIYLDYNKNKEDSNGFYYIPDYMSDKDIINEVEKSENLLAFLNECKKIESIDSFKIRYENINKPMHIIINFPKDFYDWLYNECKHNDKDISDDTSIRIIVKKEYINITYYANNDIKKYNNSEFNYLNNLNFNIYKEFFLDQNLNLLSELHIPYITDQNRLKEIYEIIVKLINDEYNTFIAEKTKKENAEKEKTEKQNGWIEV